MLCGALMLAPVTLGTFSESAARSVEALVLVTHFQDFAKGIISVTAVFYFVALTGFGLYLNVVVLSRRHWPSQAGGRPMWTHHVVRAAAVAVLLVSVGTMSARASLRLDVTAERLHTLSDETRALIDQLPTDRPVFVQAYISPIVPEAYVQSRSNLVSILEEIDSLAGSKIELLVHETEPFSEAAREARETFRDRASGLPGCRRRARRYRGALPRGGLHVRRGRTRDQVL